MPTPISDITCMLPVEIFNRGFDAKLYLGLKCLQAGFKSFVIGARSGVEDYMLRADTPYFYVPKSILIREHARSFCAKIMLSGGAIFPLDEEIGIFPKIFDDENMMRGGYNSKRPLLYERVFFWGENNRQSYIKRTPYMRAQAPVVVGNPRFDLCKPMFNRFYNTLNTRKMPTPYIQINTTFSLHNHYLGEDYEIHNSTGKLKDLYIRYGESERKDFQAFLLEAKKVFIKFPQLNFVVRPHPSENEQIYIDEFAGFSNVLISREGTSHQWAINALMVIHTGCTTAIEAFINQKEVILFSLEPESDFIPALTTQVSTPASTGEELINIIESKLPTAQNEENSDTLTDTRNKHIAPVIANINFDSAEAIINEFVAAAQDITLPAKRRKFITQRSLYRKMRSKAGDLLVRMGLKKGSKGYDYYKSKFPRLSNKIIANRIDAMKYVVGNESGSYKIKTIAENCFEIRKKA